MRVRTLLIVLLSVLTAVPATLAQVNPTSSPVQVQRDGNNPIYRITVNVVERTATDLIGTKGYPRHAHITGEGAVPPKRTVTVVTHDRDGNPYVKPQEES